MITARPWTAKVKGTLGFFWQHSFMSLATMLSLSCWNNRVIITELTTVCHSGNHWLLSGKSFSDFSDTHSSRFNDEKYEAIFLFCYFSISY